MKRTLIMGLVALFVFEVMAQVQNQRTDEYEVRYNSRGFKVYEAIDSNGDGRYDTFYHYDDKGLLVRLEMDTTHDGKIDTIIRYLDGMYVSSIERDTNGDGVFDNIRKF